MKNILIVSVPVSPLGSPWVTVPYLVGQLKGHNQNAVGCDLNMEFLEYILTEKYIEKSILKADLYIEKNKNKKDKNTRKKINKITKFLNEREQSGKNVCKYIELAKNVL